MQDGQQQPWWICAALALGVWALGLQSPHTPSLVAPPVACDCSQAVAASRTPWSTLLLIGLVAALLGFFAGAVFVVKFVRTSSVQNVHVDNRVAAAPDASSGIASPSSLRDGPSQGRRPGHP